MIQCLHCGEIIGPNDPYHRIPSGNSQFFHVECFMRMLIGGLNHLRGDCTCCGGSEPPDPPDVSVRDAARAAVAFHALRNKLIDGRLGPLAPAD